MQKDDKKLMLSEYQYDINENLISEMNIVEENPANKLESFFEYDNQNKITKEIIKSFETESENVITYTYSENTTRKEFYFDNELQDVEIHDFSDTEETITILDSENTILEKTEIKLDSEGREISKKTYLENELVEELNTEYEKDSQVIHVRDFVANHDYTIESTFKNDVLIKEFTFASNREVMSSYEATLDDQLNIIEEKFKSPQENFLRKLSYNSDGKLTEVHSEVENNYQGEKSTHKEWATFNADGTIDKESTHNISSTSAKYIQHEYEFHN